MTAISDTDGSKPPVPDPLTVLIIEDEESFIEALTVGLKREGFAVTAARDGIEGIDLVDSTQRLR